MRKKQPIVPFRQLLLLLLIITAGMAGRAQQVDSIFFNLYTDSLKKGTYNYINVDGKMSNGRWIPLTGKEIIFTSTAGKFDNNSLILDKDFKEEKVTVKAVLRADTTIAKSVTIYIKKKEDNEKLRTEEEILRDMQQKPKPKSRKSRR